MTFRQLQRRFLLYMVVVVIALWVLVPLALIALAAFTPRLELYQWPRPVLPSGFSTATMSFFLRSYGTLTSLRNSALVALLTLGMTLAVGAPAGYAVARYVFRGREAFRIGILMTRMFPTSLLAIPLIVTFIRWQLYDTLIGVAFIHTAMALPFASSLHQASSRGFPRNWKRQR